jgi:tetratricopeptide (TPR) repeat protein
MIFGLAFYYLSKILIHDPQNNKKLLALCMIFGMVGYVVFASFSYPMERIFHSVFLLIMLSITIATYSRLETERSCMPRPVVIGICCLIIAGLVFAMYNGVIRASAEIYTKRALAARANQNWPGVVAAIDKGYSDWATLDNASTPLAWYRGEANFLMNYIGQAHEDFEKAFKAHPYHIHVLNNLGTCFEMVDKHEEAIDCYEKALHIFPEFRDASINLGATYYNCGRYEQAKEVLDRQWRIQKSKRLEFYLEEVNKKLDRNTITQ